MKTKLILSIFIFLAGWGLGLLTASFVYMDYVIKEQPKQEIKVQPTYNVSKDSFILDVLKTKPISIIKNKYRDGNSCHVYIRFKEFELYIVHELAIEYECKESWFYSCTLKDGSKMLIQSYGNIESNKLSKSTYNILKNYCK